MNDNIICFSDNYSDVKTAFKDYMFHYMSKTEGRDDYVYDKNLSFEEKEKMLDVLMKREITKLSGVNFDENGLVSKAMWANHPMLKWASFAVVDAFIDMIIPDVLDKSIGIYTDQRYINYGDSASFNIESNDLFYVSKAGRDQRTVEFQRQYQGQVTIIPENREMTVYVNFYRVLCGLDSLAKFVTKAVLSMELQITREVYTAFDKAMDALPTTPVDGNLKVAGFSQNSAVKLAQTVTAFNGGAKAIFLGTQLALQSVMPTDANYRYFLDSEYVKLGYLRTAFGFDTLVLPQIADWKNPYKLAMKDDKIYVVSPSSQKLLKLVYEGSSRTNSIGAYESANLTESTTINKSWGIGVATNSIAGVITLA